MNLRAQPFFRTLCLRPWNFIQTTFACSQTYSKLMLYLNTEGESTCYEKVNCAHESFCRPVNCDSRFVKHFRGFVTQFDHRSVPCLHIAAFSKSFEDGRGRDQNRVTCAFTLCLPFVHYEPHITSLFPWQDLEPSSRRFISSTGVMRVKGLAGGMTNLADLANFQNG